MDYGELKTRCQAIVGRANANFGTYINERQRRVCREYNFSFLQRTFDPITTEDGVGSYDLPAGFKDDLHVYYVNEDGQNHALEQIDLMTAWGRYGTTAQSKGSPRAWTLQATQLSIWPIPDGAYTIKVEGFGYLADLSGDSDTNELTDNWPELLVAGAVADHYAEKGQTEEFMFWESRFQKLFADLRVHDVSRSLAGVTHMVPRTGPLDR